MYLKPRTKLRLHFNHDLSDFDEDVYFPNEGHQIKRSPMRRRYNKEGRNPWTKWYSDLGHGCEDWHTADTMIEGFIHKNIGNKFDDVFHEFMNKVRIRRELHCYGYHTPKSMFLGYFEKDKRRRTQGTYYVDDNGIIRQIPWKPKKPKDIIVYRELKWPNKYIYTLREDALLSISVPFITLFGRDLYNEILFKKTFDEIDLDRLYIRMRKHCSDETFEVAFNQVRRYREFKHYCYYYRRNRKWVNFLFNSKYNNMVHVIKYGTKEYFQYIREQKRIKSLATKGKRHPDRTNFDNILKDKKVAHNVKKRTERFEQLLKNNFKSEM